MSSSPRQLKVLRIIVPTTRVACPPTLALTMEGLEVIEVKMNDHLHYGRLFTELWQSREGFILVEHDVVPWPGALSALMECERECCAYEYPSQNIIPEPRSGWCISLGCTKFSTELLQRVDYGYEWQNRPWDSLDGAVYATLQEAGVEVHIHQPPVAHVKANTLVLRRVGAPR